ncbi:mitochondrial ribosomal protein [Grosmannia clavigera kw1407]|uniref:Mitochondrial ribosomal protein n=1 Tax=Grosmannia clavigera (strain kw1407 / UAMH 11150) TaxID=655863 RepID=F0XUE5_GROCL|nr:mitochondrial ribosomal protein [Grosmannia clavigera kw1407]EFW98418.1 mitochondrial ribosomal protein [Grosmannia clavigera kw1407]
MSVAAPLARRPLGSSWLQMTTQRLARRFASDALTVRPSPAVSIPTHFHSIPTKEGRIRTAFAVYAPQLPASSTSTSPTPSASSLAKTPRVDVIRAYHEQQIARMDPTGARGRLFSRKNPDSAKPGDVLLVTPSRAGGETFAGVCLAVRRSGIETAILLRGQLAKTGVERWFKIYSRAVAAIDIIQRRPRRARRARLTYMRQPKHDRGAVDDLVKAWRRGRNVLRTRGSAATSKTSPAVGAKSAPAKK